VIDVRAETRDLAHRSAWPSGAGRGAQKRREWGCRVRERAAQPRWDARRSRGGPRVDLGCVRVACACCQCRLSSWDTTGRPKGRSSRLLSTRRGQEWAVFNSSHKSIASKLPGDAALTRPVRCVKFGCHRTPPSKKRYIGGSDVISDFKLFDRLNARLPEGNDQLKVRRRTPKRTLLAPFSVYDSLRADRMLRAGLAEAPCEAHIPVSR